MRSPRPAGATASGDGLRGGPSDHVDPLQPRHAPVRSPDGPAIPRRDRRDPRRAVRDPDRTARARIRRRRGRLDPAAVRRRADRCPHASGVGHQDAGRPRSRLLTGARVARRPYHPCRRPCRRAGGWGDGGGARPGRLHRLPRHLPRRPFAREESPAFMKTRTKILLGVAGGYLLAMILIVVFFGATRRDNKEFLPQNEFKLDTWISL